ncbi:MAG: C40 family peptidase [Hyphomicrobium sp.]|nr:C40 family peptidase [Hyphomicrobium sp.]
MAERLLAERVVALARSWVGTPYHHQASRKGIGADCLGLVRGVWRDLYGRDPDVAADYSADWAEASGIETMLEGAARHLINCDAQRLAPGYVVVFRLRTGTVAKHAAIVASETTMIHAMEGGLASEVALTVWWRRRIAGAFRFPLVEDLISTGV